MLLITFGSERAARTVYGSFYLSVRKAYKDSIDNGLKRIISSVSSNLKFFLGNFSYVNILTLSNHKRYDKF
jgi:hypothetical protein